MSRAGLLAVLGDGPAAAAVDPAAPLAAMAHRGPLRHELAVPGLRAWVVSHDGRGDGWDVHDGGTDGWTVVLHGRLRPAGPGPAAAVAHGLDAHGPDGLARLLGPFALVARHPATDRTVLARSGAGDRPLFHAEAGGALVVAGEQAALRDVPGVDRTVDERAVATTLGGGMELDDATFRRGVCRVRPGTAVVLRPGTRAERSLWPTLPVAPFTGDADTLARTYADLLRDVLADSLPPAGGVLCDVSGGLDSSGVAVLLAPILPDADRRLVTLTQVFDDVPAADERAPAEAVLAGLPGRHVVERPAAPGPAELVDEARRTDDVPLQANRTPLPLLRRLAAEGATHWVTGQGGDELFETSVVVDHLRRGRPRRALGAARQRGGGGAPATARVLWGDALRPLLRIAVRRSGLGRRPADPPLVDRRWLDRIGWSAPDPLLETAPVLAGSAGAVLAAARSPYSTLVDEQAERYAALAGLELVQPYLDRALVELFLSLPPDLRLRGGDARWVQRTVPGLPRTVADRRWKAEFSVQLAEAVAAALAEPTTLRAAAATGWFGDPDPEALRARVRALDRPDLAWAVVSVDAWLQGRDPGGPA